MSTLVLYFITTHHTSEPQESCVEIELSPIFQKFYQRYFLSIDEKNIREQFDRFMVFISEYFHRVFLHKKAMIESATFSEPMNIPSLRELAENKEFIDLFIECFAAFFSDESTALEAYNYLFNVFFEACYNNMQKIMQA